MVKYNKRTWEIKKKEIIDYINSISKSKFNLSNIKSEIEKNIPINCLNKNDILTRLNNIKGLSGIYVNNSNNLYSKIPQRKIELINIIKLIEIDTELNIVKFIKKLKKWLFKNGWNIINTIISILAMLIAYLAYLK